MYARIHMLANDVSGFFVELENSFWTLVEYFLQYFVVTYSMLAIHLNTLKFNLNYL